MKKFLMTAALGLVLTSGATAQAKKPPTPVGERPLLAVVTTNRADAQLVVRTNRLTDRMAQQLRLNNYQMARLRRINRDKVTRMMEAERQYATNPKRVDEACQGICQERDQELKNLLSTAQYMDYFESRPDFYQYDKQFLTQNRDAANRNQTGYNIPGMAAPVEVQGSQPNPVLRSKD